MTTGPIDPKIVSDRLALVRHCLEDLRALPSANLDEFLADRRNAHVADSLLRRSIETLFDTARHLLAKGFGVGAVTPLELFGIVRDDLPDLARLADALGAAAARLHQMQP